MAVTAVSCPRLPSTLTPWPLLVTADHCTSWPRGMQLREAGLLVPAGRGPVAWPWVFARLDPRAQVLAGQETLERASRHLGKREVGPSSVGTPSLASWAASHWLSVAQRLAVSCPDAGLSALFAGVGASMSVCECGLLPWEKSHFVPSCGTERLVLGPERTFTHPSPLSRVLKETCLSSPSEATALPSCQSPAHSPDPG